MMQCLGYWADNEKVNEKEKEKEKDVGVDNDNDNDNHQKAQDSTKGFTLLF